MLNILLPSTKKLIINLIGIYICFIIFDFFQEKVVSSSLDGQKFRFFIFILFLEFLGNTIFGYFVWKYENKERSGIHILWFFLCAILYTTSLSLAIHSFKYVTYPVKIFVRCCKSIFIMFFGYLIASKTHPIRKIVVVIISVLGVSLFFILYEQQIQQTVDSNGKSSTEVLFGALLLILSLVADGLLAGVQEKMKSMKIPNPQKNPYTFTEPNTPSNKPSVGEWMFHINLFSSSFLFIYLIFHVNTEFVPAISYLYSTSLLFNQVFCVCTISVGVIFVYRTLKQNGTLALSIITMTRKFLSILLSVFWNGHEMGSLQWCCVVSVFGSQILDKYLDNKQHEQQHTESPPKREEKV